MKKLLLLLLTVFIGFGSLTVTAQSVTVANGTDVNNYIPLYGLWMDESQHNQIIYPESMLTNLVGKTVNTMMFYLSSEPSNSWTSSATLSVGTSATSSFSRPAAQPWRTNGPGSPRTGRTLIPMNRSQW